MARARNVLGKDLMPIRPTNPKHVKKEKKLITSADLGRHFVRRLGKDEYLIRDEKMVEEIWKPDPHGIVFGRFLRLSFVIVLGMTERRVPEDLRHIYPV